MKKNNCQVRKTCLGLSFWQLFFPYCLLFLPCSALSISPADFFIPTWNVEGQQFFTYQVMRDEIVASLRYAKQRILVVTYFFSDGDIASALKSARLRGLQVNVLLDSQHAYKFGSQMVGLAGQNVMVMKSNVQRYAMEGQTTLVIDNSVWRLSSRLDDKSEGVARIDRSPFTADEVFGWFQNITPEPTPENGNSKSASAKTPTKPDRRGIRIFGTMSESSDPKASSAQPIPKKLPRETRIQRLKRKGTSEQGENPSVGGTRRPEPSSRESDLSTDF